MIPHFAFGLGHTRAFDTLLIAVVVIYLIGQAAVAVVYTYFSYNYVKPLQIYLRHPDSHPTKEHVIRVRRLIFYLVVSVVAMVMQTGTVLVSFVYIATHKYGNINDAIVLFVPLGILIFSRITVSYSQIMTIAPSLDKNFSTLCRCHAGKRELYRRWNAVSPAPNGNEGNGPASDDTSLRRLAAPDDSRTHSSLTEEIQELVKLASIIKTGSVGSQTSYQQQQSPQQEQQPPEPWQQEQQQRKREQRGKQSRSREGPRASSPSSKYGVCESKGETNAESKSEGSGADADDSRSTTQQASGGLAPPAPMRLSRSTSRSTSRSASGSSNSRQSSRLPSIDEDE